MRPLEPREVPNFYGYPSDIEVYTEGPRTGQVFVHGVRQRWGRREWESLGIILLWSPLLIVILIPLLIELWRQGRKLDPSGRSVPHSGCEADIKAWQSRRRNTY